MARILRMKFRVVARKLDVFLSNTTTFTLTATSGMGEYMNDPAHSNRRGEGPLPIGTYTVNPRELSDPNIVLDYRLNWMDGDWGDWNIPLHPARGTITHGRSGFYIHGGSKEGSLGCIDIGGGINGNTETNRLKGLIAATLNPFTVSVQ
jgi:hypothetical protein